MRLSEILPNFVKFAKISPKDTLEEHGGEKTAGHAKWTKQLCQEPTVIDDDATYCNNKCIKTGIPW